MRTWDASTFVFVSTNASHAPGGPEDRMLAAGTELVRLGATVVLLCMRDNPIADEARKAGIQVAPYVLDKWNVVRSRSRLRKYLKRYQPVAAHSTGVEGDVLLRLAARPLSHLRIVHTLTDAAAGGTRRTRPVRALFHRFDLTGIRGVDAIFAETPSVAQELLGKGFSAERVIDDPIADGPALIRAAIKQYITLYRSFMLSA